ncbi:hemagglutinin [Xanthomonas oryzae pv. oryzae]|uniref:Hemagglutinin n=5 Tax=Xanthomonas oryzae TaxID=347 RepID=A0A854CKD4_XANOO|nr:putative Ig domain-containing protein [Xanthomonas oryzae]OLG40041.1 hemagglutinin [Xanthomonas oryzae pv. oryzae]OLG43671.1 hemagglutinin [Xanthomonas oryzae pv. oryzae]OLG54328.1 hemagglutinin [Xanthomonas oryzae pv. oryzae]OLG58605.1 hemagglutinin [Xanthomonas oryzae pv. oryzae]OLG65492.1 hemagglutinin [Xanthomonas oryzae pv. oryzae]
MTLRWLMALLLMATSQACLAAYCTSPKTATVNSGQSVTFDVTDCDGPSDGGMTDPLVPASHGSYVLSGQSGPGTETVTYTNNGDGATSDSFYLLDENNNQVVFNITINPSRTASITVSPSSANEDSGTSFIYTVTLSQTNTSATTVNLTRSGTATSGTDYTGAVTSVVVPANTASASFSVTPVADTTVETDETVTFQVASGTGYSTGSPSSATATIVNDDFPSASIAVSPASVTEDGATNLLYTVTLNQPSPTALSIGFGVGGTATSGTDYAAVNSPLVIAAGQTTGTITINPTADSTVEPDETVVISLNAGSGYTVGSPNSATGTILNDDAVVTISPASLPAATAGSAYSQTLSASGGTPGYTFVVSAGTLPAGLTLSASGVLSGTPTASGSFNFTVTATDSGAPTSGSRAYTLTVAGANVTLPATTLPAGTAGQAYSSAITPATGGIAPYSYALTAGALPAGITLNTSSGTLSGTTTSVGSVNFTVTATDSTSGTPSQGTRGYTLNIAARTIAVAPSTVPTATRGTAYSQTLTASGGTAAYTYAITSGALPAGITLASNGTLSGTATLEGTFNFTVQATDANSFTGTQAYSLTVAGPNLVLPASTLPAGTAGQAYAAAIAPATGGTAPYSYAVTAGALPGGVVLDAATGGLSGTPTVSGTFTFTLTVTDSTPSPAAQASRSYALTVNAATLVLGQPTLPAAVRGTAYSQVLTASGGIAPYRYSIASGTLPAGLTLASDGTLSGTPTVQGTSSFTIAVADAGNATATQAYTFTVNDAAPVAVADVAATMTDTAVTAAVTANDTGSITAIAIASAPTNGTAVVSGLEVVYTPNAGFTGTDVLSYTATGAGGTSAAVTLTITVNVRPVAVSVTAAAVPGEAQQVDITRHATGGPFVAAAVVAVLPASAGTATITRVGGTATAAAARASGLSPAATAMAEAPTFTLTFTPNPAFVGQATVQFTLSNAVATSAPASVVFTIAPWRAPSVDAEVRGLIDAQSESTRRFARAQIDNFQRRLEATHRGGGSFTNAVSFQPTSHCRQAERGISGQLCSPDTQDADNDFRDAPAVASSTGSSAQTPGDLGLWVGGAIRSGSLNRQTNSNGVEFQTDGLSVGADYRVASSLAIGAGLGWGRDDSDVGSNGSHSKATAYTMALYASFRPGKAFFFDTLVGYQMLSYDLRRFVTDDSSLAEGNRDGKQWIASLSTGADLQRGTLQITLYARVDVARATLDGYAEQGVAPFALRYADMDVATTTTGNLGLRLEWRREVAWGRLSPQLRVEYQRDFQGRGDAILSYADLTGGPFYRTAQSAFDRNRLMVGIGAALLTEQGLSTRLEYRGITDGDSNNDQTWMINLEKKY